MCVCGGGGGCNVEAVKSVSWGVGCNEEAVKSGGGGGVV